MTEPIETFDLDFEPGHIVVPPPNSQLLRVCKWFFVALIVVGYISEYQQEAAVIRLLKETHPITDECITVEPGNWFERATGLEEARASICHEQHRIAALSWYPNLLLVFVTLPWRCVMGDTPIHTITSLLAHQSYVVQIAMILVAGCVAGLLFYNLVMAIPKFITSVAQMPDNDRVQRYELVQAQLRPPPKLSLVQLKAKQRQATLTRRQPMLITQEEV